MPITKHFLCSWHLYKNLKEQTDKHLRGDADLLRACRAAFRKAEYAATEEEFGGCWDDLMVSMRWWTGWSFALLLGWCLFSRFRIFSFMV
ncbi:unnamed protein product [Phaeothamnion confervicola]